MTNDPDEIILPILRDIRTDMKKMSDNMALMTAEMTAMRQHTSGIATLQDHDHGDIADLKLRLERVEERLGLID